VDEWGIYDPSQAGLEALFGRLESKRPTAEPDSAKIAASMEEAARLAETRRTK
jgi:hypothetical protein